MKKLSISISILTFVLPLYAELKRDPATYRYCSIPSSQEINQNEYHQLVWTCKDILEHYAQEHAALLAQYPGVYRSGSYDPNNKAGKVTVLQYLERIANPTSMRLLADLKNINFAI
jgi:hypothetical protein